MKKKKRKIRKKAKTKKRKNRISSKTRKSRKTRRKSKTKRPKAKKRKKSTKKLDVESFISSLKPRFTFNLQEFLTRLISPLTDKIRDYRINKERLKIRQRKEEEEQKLHTSL